MCWGGIKGEALHHCQAIEQTWPMLYEGQFLRPPAKGHCAKADNMWWFKTTLAQVFNPNQKENCMIGYATFGTNDLPRAAEFYDTLMAEVGAKRMWETARGIAWGTAPEKPSVAIMKPFDGNPATVGNGAMVGLEMDSREKVDRMHKRALELGGKDEGAVSQRGEGFYAGFFRDLEGNKFSVFFSGQ
jgi:catechol 2,3-dioxygenase-like lactoylglutathione lyase family enzyme